MNFVALRMLTGDRAKYFGLVFAIAFCTFLLENQTSIFANILKGGPRPEAGAEGSNEREEDGLHEGRKLPRPWHQAGTS
jgi:putative ABC transport system permease protein